MNNLYEQYGPKLPYGLTQADIQNPKQAIFNRIGNVTNPKEYVLNMVRSGRLSQNQLNGIIQLVRPFINGPL